MHFYLNARDIVKKMNRIIKAIVYSKSSVGVVMATRLGRSSLKVNQHHDEIITPSQVEHSQLFQAEYTAALGPIFRHG